jgi:hypothetical protein
MKNPLRSRAMVVTVGGLLLGGGVALTDVAGASSIRFSDFTPLASSAGPTADEAARSRSATLPCSSGPWPIARRNWQRARPTPATGT